VNDLLQPLWDPWGLLLLAGVGVAVAALANGMETGLYRVNRIRLRLAAGRGDRRAATLLSLQEDLPGQIIVCLLTYNAGAYLTTVVVTTLVAEAGWAGSPLAVEATATAVVTPLLFAFADVVPKTVFALEADRWTYRLASAMRWAYRLMRAVGLVPVLRGLSGLALRLVGGTARAGAEVFSPRQRLRAVIQEGLAEGVITGYQGELAERVLALRHKRVAEVMIPMREVAAVPVDATRTRLQRELRRHSFSRLPVYETRRDRIVGIVHVHDLLARDRLDLSEVMRRDVVRLRPETPVGTAMVRMRRARAAMAVVEDARGRALGIVTIKDLVEEIVGDLAQW